MQYTPRSNQLHIGLFGKRNSGKSSLINAITRQNTAIVSDVPGTTTDPVRKSMELQGIGACVLIDTPGIDDSGELGEMRVKQTLRVTHQVNIAIMVCSDVHIDQEYEWSKKLDAKGIPVVWLINKCDLLTTTDDIKQEIEKRYGQSPIIVSAFTRKGIDFLLQKIRDIASDTTTPCIVSKTLANQGDTVMLVMPQDSLAPKGRLILPQVQTIRELLDRKCLVMSCTTDQIDNMLHTLNRPPKLIITDSQAFKTVYDKKPEESKLTSFSILFAKQKGDIDYYMQSARCISRLNETSHVLIAEACTHVPDTEDIGRIKIPLLLRKHAGEHLHIDHVSGNDFPEDLSQYDLIIHCGACMFNRQYVLQRISQARRQHIPMTNYGVAIAFLSGIIDKIDY